MAADGRWTVDELYALVRRADTFADAGPRRRSRRCSACSPGDYPVRRVRRAAAARHLGSRGGHGREPARRAHSGGHQRRHDPRPRPVRRLPGRTVTGTRHAGRAAGVSASSTRRWCTRHGRARSFLLGASAWRIEEITRRPGAGVARRRASRARCRSGRATRPGRPIELGRALGEFTRQIADELPHRASVAAQAEKRGSARPPARRARGGQPARRTWPSEQAATGALPTDRTIVVERFRDELGDWRIVVLTPFGARVHAPWALAIEARLREALGLEVQPIWSDDGIVIRLPMTDELPASPGRHSSRRGAGVAAADEAIRSRPTTSRSWSSAARRLGPLRGPLPRERGTGAAAAAPRAGQRTPLWQQRQRSAQLLGVASAATPPSRSSSRPTANASTTSSTCPRCSRSWPRSSGARSACQCRDEHALALRGVAAVRLHRVLHVRGRRAAG